MRSNLLLNYLSFSALSIVIHRYPSCLVEAADTAASLPNEKGYRINEIRRQNGLELISDYENRKDRPRKLIDKKIQTPVRRKRELRETISSLRLQRRSPRSERQAEVRSSRKLFENNRNNEFNRIGHSVAKIAEEAGENRENQDKQNNFVSKVEEEKEKKRSLHSNSPLTTFKSKSSQVEGSNEAVKSNSNDEELDENSEEYNDETVEEDEEPEDAENIVSGGYKAEEEETPEESDSDSNSENVAEYDEFEGQEMGKRETQESKAAEDYECDSAADEEESGQDERQEAELTEKRRRGERFDGRVKRNDNEAEDNEELSKSESLEDDPVDKSKREGEPEAIKSQTEEPNSSVENSGEKKEATPLEDSAEVESPDGESERRKNSEGNTSFEDKVEMEIQKKIDSIKQEIKRAIEEREKIHEIEINNAKFDELQSEAETEDEDERGQSLDAVDSDSEKNPLKISSVASMKINKRRAKRSQAKDLVHQLQAVEGVEKLDPDVLTKAKLRHESIKKRSAPVFGAIDTPEPLMERNSSPRQTYISNNENDDTGSSATITKAKRTLGEARKENPSVIIPEQAKAKIEDEMPAGYSLDPSLLVDSENNKEISKRNPELINFTRRRRASALIPEGRVAFLGYRADQDEGDDDEGGEFEDDGFQDRTSNLREEKSHYTEDENRANYFLFPGLDRASDREEDSLVRRKRAGSRGGGTTIGRRRARGRAKQLQNVKIASRKKNLMDRDKRQAKINLRSDNVASLVGSTQELSPRLATEYKEAFGGLQSDPGGALARFKRVKRGVIRAS